MNTPIIPNTADDRVKLHRHHDTCRRPYSRESPFTPWKRGDPVGTAVVKPTKGTIPSPSLWDHWPTVAETWNPSGSEDWPPHGVRLTNAWLYLVVKHMPRLTRAERYPAEFDTLGHIQMSRTPTGPTVLIRAHGLLCYPVYRGYYVLSRSTASVITHRSNSIALPVLSITFTHDRNAARLSNKAVIKLQEAQKSLCDTSQRGSATGRPALQYSEYYCVHAHVEPEAQTPKTLFIYDDDQTPFGRQAGT
ncbi:hypothetical protein BO71DRAFT_434280 [Aspergillus ellipticus CBS 707.79]|uniref:Uncharacterized protein n=1 Tax=Aspergillus ellipticus CBS 707.79 TaxID=1448320 RepID=A0A319CY73_9EURO|nr:hypothetical protein BO71DRAFT_434280 [Aspergillus ellipticus CBS 707.79]